MDFIYLVEESINLKEGSKDFLIGNVIIISDNSFVVLNILSEEALTIIISFNGILLLKIFAPLSGGEKLVLTVFLRYLMQMLRT